MSTEEALQNLNEVLAAEGIPYKERVQRLAIFQGAVEFGETMSAKLKAEKAKKAKMVRKMTVGHAIEASIYAGVIGWLLGIITVQAQ